MKINNGLIVMLLVRMVIWSMISVIPDRVKALPSTLVDLTLQPELPKGDVSLGSKGFSPSFAIFGIILVSLVLGKKKWLSGKEKPPNYPKDLYSELSMSMR
jgi:hypothetical protein